jgi:hypothetical protein
MTTKQVTIILFCNEIYGVLFEDEDYFALGGQSLVNAFDGHHVQLVRAPSGQYRIVDDMNCAICVDNVSINQQRNGCWKLNAKQSDDVRVALSEYANHDKSSSEVFPWKSSAFA